MKNKAADLQALLEGKKAVSVSIETSGGDEEETTLENPAGILHAVDGGTIFFRDGDKTARFTIPADAEILMNYSGPFYTVAVLTHESSMEIKCAI